jgi:predicted aspartyl protease
MAIFDVLLRLLRSIGMTVVTYHHALAYIGNRPYADVVLNPAFGTSPTHKCLVDTGADYLTLPAHYAAGSGISLASGAPVSVVLASGGSVSMTQVSGVSVTIEGFAVIVDVFFDHTAGSLALLGRQALLAAMEAGFSATQWLYK